VKKVVIPRRGKRVARQKVQRARSFQKLVKWRTGSEARISCLNATTDGGALADVRAGWPSVANSADRGLGHEARCHRRRGPAASLAAAHQRDTVDIVGHRDV